MALQFSRCHTLELQHLHAIAFSGAEGHWGLCGLGCGAQVLTCICLHEDGRDACMHGLHTWAYIQAARFVCLLGNDMMPATRPLVVC